MPLQIHSRSQSLACLAGLSASAGFTLYAIPIRSGLLEPRIETTFQVRLNPYLLGTFVSVSSAESLIARSDPPRVTGTMEESKNKDFVFFDRKYGRMMRNRLRRRRRKSPYDLLVKQCITGQFIGRRHRHAKRIPLASPRAFSFVPRIPAIDVFLDFGKEAQIVCHFLQL